MDELQPIDGIEIKSFDIRKLQAPIGTYGQPASGCMGLNINRLAAAPAISIESIEIGGTSLSIDNPFCNCNPATCTPSGYCPITVNCGTNCIMTIWWKNSGQVTGTFTTQLLMEEIISQEIPPK